MNKKLSHPFWKQKSPSVAFGEELKKGTGGAFLIMRQHPESLFAKDIYKACLNNPDFDPQCSGSRAQYLFELIEMLENKEAVKSKLIKKFNDSKKDTLSWQQLFDLMKLFAQSGNQLAKEAVYRKFQYFAYRGESSLGDREIVDLDGLQGLLFVATEKGKWFSAHPEDWDHDCFIDCVQEKFPNTDVWKLLCAQARKNKYIKSYVDVIKKYRLRQVKRQENFSYEEITDLLKKNKGVAIGIWAKTAKREDLIRIAEDLISEKDEKLIRLRLRAFTITRFPLNYQLLFQFLDSKDKRTQSLALRALSLFKSEELRNMALMNLRKGKFLSNYLEILARNYQPKDAVLIEEIILSTDNDVEFHDMGGVSIKELYLKNKPNKKGIQKVLLDFYERGYCALCREVIIEKMIQYKLLPKYVQEEAMWDCNLDIRSLVRNISKR